MCSIGSDEQIVNGRTVPATAWYDRAPDLAAWTEERLVVRRDAYGAYTPPERRGQTYTRRDGTTATVPQSYTAKGKVTRALLVRHFRGQRPEHVIGLHSTSTANTCLAARLDIDAHGDTGNDPAANLRAALAWDRCLRRIGFRPLLNGSNGKGGYHLSALLVEPVPAARVYAFLQWLTDDYAEHGLPVRPETFPKQAGIREGGYGNWLRVLPPTTPARTGARYGTASAGWPGPRRSRTSSVWTATRRRSSRPRRGPTSRRRSVSPSALYLPTRRGGAALSISASRRTWPGCQTSARGRGGTTWPMGSPAGYSATWG